MNSIELISEIDNTPPEVGQLIGFVQGILKELNKDNWQMGLVVTDDERMREYNRRWRNIDIATDVLSFVQDDGEEIPRIPGVPIEVGDVIISLETVARNSREWDNPFEEELRRVIIHGILHLNGLDHPGDNYDTGMLKLQEELLAGTGSLMNNNQ